MVVPDLAMICEIMLVAEGFIQARELAKKFTTLYSLCAYVALSLSFFFLSLSLSLWLNGVVEWSV